MLDFRRCDGCGSHIPATAQSCPSCGRFVERLRDLVTARRLAAVGGPALLALLVLFALPDGLLGEPTESLFESGIFSVGFAPLAVAITWFLRLQRRRDPASFAARMDAAETRLEELERDVARTEARLRGAERELEREPSARLGASLRGEIDQDRRLGAAQRRLARQLEQRLQHLAIERFRSELLYFEACRDAQLDHPDAVHALRAKIAGVRTELGDRADDAWERALEDARGLHHQLSRGIERLQAARRLDPLRYADLTVDEPLEAPPHDEGDLGAQVDHHLERIDRGFEALDELSHELRGDADASGMRMRVDDELLAALDAEDEELLLVDPEARISVTGV